VLYYCLIALAAAGLISYVIGVGKARAAAIADPSKKLHSQLGYYGSYLAICTILPALILIAIWSAASPFVIGQLVRSELPSQVRALSKPRQNLIMGQVNAVADGMERLSVEDLEVLKRARLGLVSIQNAAEVLQRNGVPLGSSPESYIIASAYDTVSWRGLSQWMLIGLSFFLAFGGWLIGYRRIRPRMRARNAVEGVMLSGLILASTVAILTTVGIVFSVLFESIKFFSFISLDNFYLGTVWDPRFTSADSNRGEGQFGFIPLLWGTLYISFVALLVAVPIGLYAAIYLSEYAGNRFRSIAKPALEILAGIPTIVYGFFALVTFGPFLRDYGSTPALIIGYLLFGLVIAGLIYLICSLFGAGRAISSWFVGIVAIAILGGAGVMQVLTGQVLPDTQIAANSVLTAGIVMGIMIIPFVSSLSDDIISAVPQSLREGSYGLGATQSETISRVILPAALPGIVGAILLAASRAIGETMIVVLAAGIAAKLTVNPFENVTTITVKIVSSLTGDHEFNSPQTLVAFALGLTLFVVTLCLNIYALYIVRKYKEQYD